MAEDGSIGITKMPVLQSLAQAREKWSDLGREHREGRPRRASKSRDFQDLAILIRGRVR
jgi:hypothetical protein